MTPSNYIVIFIGLMMTLTGILNLFRPTREFMIKLGNAFRGTETEITHVTTWNYRIKGILFTIIGLIVIFVGINIRT